MQLYAAYERLISALKIYRMKEKGWKRYPMQITKKRARSAILIRQNMLRQNCNKSQRKLLYIYIPTQRNLNI